MNPGTVHGPIITKQWRLTNLCFFPVNFQLIPINKFYLHSTFHTDKGQLSLESPFFWYCFLITGLLSWNTFCFQRHSRRYQTSHSRAPSANVCRYLFQITSNLKITWWVIWYKRAAAFFPGLTNKWDFFFFTTYCPFGFLIANLEQWKIKIMNHSDQRSWLLSENMNLESSSLS